MEIITNSAEETKKIAANFAKKLKPGDVVALIGDLGTGKTTFVQGLAFGLGIKKRILSPSFLFVREYDVGQGQKFYHVDLYRIENIERAADLGLAEIFQNKNNIVAIEWAEKIKNFLPPRRIEIHLSYGEKENQRKIKFVRRNSSGR